MGTLKDHKEWIINPKHVKSLLQGKMSIGDLKEEDVKLRLQQKGIDMKIGIEIASLALKGFVDTIVLIAGDSGLCPCVKVGKTRGYRFCIRPHCLQM